jgi:hypothetical protein
MMRRLSPARQWFTHLRHTRAGRWVLRWRVLGWLVRVVPLVWLIGQVAPAPMRAPLLPPQTVEVVHPHLCIHTRLIDEVPEYRMQQTFIALREMGAPTVVEFFPWAYVERAAGQDDWSQPDKIFRHARTQGVSIIARMGFVPEWARADQPDSTFNTLPDSAFEPFAAFSARFAARYADQLAGLIVWNEPNLSFEWGFRPPDPAAYARLLSVVYPAVKAAAPAVPVMGGALAPTVEPLGSPHALDDLLYLRAMLEAGAGAHMDALAVHTYGFTHPHDAPPAPDRLNFRRVELLRAVLDEYGLTALPISITETGWNDHPRWAQAVTPAQRIDYTLGAYRWAAQHWPTVRHVCLWMFRTPRPTASHPDYFTLVTPDFDLKPIYHALKAYGTGEAD